MEIPGLSFAITTLDAFMGAIALVLALLYYLGLQHCANGEGRPIMRAIVVFWTGFGAFCFGQMYFEIYKFTESKLCSNTAHLIFQISLNVTLTLALTYYVWATVRRNPPKPDNSGESYLRNLRR